MLIYHQTNELIQIKHRFASVEKIIQWGETHWLTGKEKVLGAVKKVMLTVFRDMKKTIKIDFLEKGTTVNSISYSLCNISPYLSNVPRTHTHTHMHTHKYTYTHTCPVGWGCRIHRLHLYWGVSPTTTTMGVLDVTLNNLMVKLQ